MEELQEHFYTSIHAIEYSVIQKGMLYIVKYIPEHIWNNCVELKIIYISYGLNKIAPYWNFTNSYLYACLHIMLLFDHTFVNTSLKRNNHMKISKLDNDTINNLLYLFCKQNIIQDINTSFIENLSNYQYNLPTIINYINDIHQNCNFTTDQRINIMLHCKSNDALDTHELKLLTSIFLAYDNSVKLIGQHMTTQNACLIDE
jgi:hypothetical protein